MAYYRDLSPCDYFFGRAKLLAVGWLEGGHDYPRGRLPDEEPIRVPSSPGRSGHKIRFNIWATLNVNGP